MAEADLETCSGTLQTFGPVDRTENFFYCALNGGIFTTLVTNAPAMVAKYKRAMHGVLRKDKVLPNIVVLLESVIVVLWLFLLLGDTLNAYFATTTVSYASGFAICYMMMHSLYTSQLSLLNTRLFAISRSVSTLTVSKGFAVIENVLTLYAIVSPIMYSMMALRNIGSLFDTWGAYNRQFIAEVALILIVLMASLFTSFKYDLMSDKKILTVYRNIGIMLIQPVIAMVFDTLESELQVYSPPMGVWKFLEGLLLVSSIFTTNRMDAVMRASETASPAITGRDFHGIAVNSAGSGRLTAKQSS